MRKEKITDATMALLEKWQNSDLIAGIAVVPTGDELSSSLSAKLAESDLGSAPRYLRETRGVRTDPRRLRPWARSIFILAVPFASLPDDSSINADFQNSGLFKFENHPELETKQSHANLPSPSPLGVIATYAAKLDYHRHAKKLLSQFANELESTIRRSFRSEPAVDTLPLMERSLARFAGLGVIGRNKFLLVSGYGSGCFLCELITEISFTRSRVFGGNPQLSKSDHPCAKCAVCLSACPSGALQKTKNASSPFIMDRCVSYLTMEKRGILSEDESKLIGDKVFGCDDCITQCPGTNLPRAAWMDLNHLLEAPSGEIRRAITGTPLEYAGVTLLRRNALIVLGNKGTTEAIELVSRFSRKTKSELLRKTAEIVLRQRTVVKSSLTS